MSIYLKEMSDKDITALPAATLAFMGDTVYETLVRQYHIKSGGVNAAKLHRRSVAMSRAGFQSNAAKLLFSQLTEAEAAVFKRGKAVSSRIPRNADMLEYRRATALETLFGWLYLQNKRDRLAELFCECEKLYEKEQESENKSKTS